MEPDLHALIEELRLSGDAPQAAGAPDSWTIVQTHISVVLLGGTRAYKFKKALDLGFLDFRTFEQRLHGCREEVRLNRRLARDVYLGVAHLVRCAGGGLRLRSSGEEADEGELVLDAAVEMVRLPEQMMLDRRLDEGTVTVRDMERLAERVADFHRTCATGEGIDEYGEPDALAGQIDGNLRQMAELPVAGLLGPERVIDVISARMRVLLEDVRAVIDARVRSGCIREGHGDLHARNICMPPGDVIIFDCIEFSMQFRCRDVAAEIAYAAMDLTHRGHPELAEALLARYAELSGDHGMRAVQPLYQAHFAIVRAKVEAIRAAEGGRRPAGDHAEALAHARAYLQRAAGLTQPPGIVLMCGLPGSGKSVLAGHLARRLGCDVVRSDVLRKSLAGMKPTDRSADADLYSPAMSRRVYDALLDAVRAAVAARRLLVVDATLATRARRDPFLAFCAASAARFLLIETTCGEAESRRRLTARARRADDASDADGAVFDKALAQYEPPDEVPPSQRLVAATDRLSDPELMDAVMARLMEW